MPPAAVLMLGAGALAGVAAMTHLALIIFGVLAVLIYLYAPRAPGR